jgi:hypothetical protein
MYFFRFFGMEIGLASIQKNKLAVVERVMFERIWPFEPGQVRQNVRSMEKVRSIIEIVLSTKENIQNKENKFAKHGK